MKYHLLRVTRLFVSICGEWAAVATGYVYIESYLYIGIWIHTFTATPKIMTNKTVKKNKYI